MALYYYLKARPKRTIVKRRFSWRLASLVLIGGGMVFLLNAFAPLVLYELKSVRFQRPVTPLVLGGTSAARDYRNPRNWFPVAPQLPPRPSKITHYSLSVPKLKIKDAVVRIGGEDLMASLIHYPGTALPGQFGNAVVFGHSVLPQFFSPENYKAIFSTLPRLEKGDPILVDFDGVLYHYQVTELAETSPEDLTVLEQRFDDSYLSLITCVPPGTYLKRLVIQARLVRS